MEQTGYATTHAETRATTHPPSLTHYQTSSDITASKHRTLSSLAFRECARCHCGVYAWGGDHERESRCRTLAWVYTPRVSRPTLPYRGDTGIGETGSRA